MNILVELFQTGLEQGLILALVALGITVPFRLLGFADLTAEGAYPLGGVCCAVLLSQGGLPPALCVILACLAAGLLGVGTASLHLRFNLNTLLAGIILSTMVYGLDLRLMGRPNISIHTAPTVFGGLVHSNLALITILSVLILIFIAGAVTFLHTQMGLRLRAVGLSPVFAQRQGASRATYTLAGLFVGNALCGLGGAIMVQTQGYADVGMGIGIVIHALAALMIGETLLGTRTLTRQLLSPILGALIYQQIQGLALLCGLAPSDLKLLTGAIVLAVIVLRGKQAAIE